MKPLTFEAEIKKVTSRKLASLDVKHQVPPETIESSVVALGMLDGDVTVKVTVEISDE